jgi:hypothetical protein
MGDVENGDLLAAAEKVFDAFITTDKNLRYQQNLSGRRRQFWRFQRQAGRKSKSTSARFLML